MSKSKDKSPPSSSLAKSDKMQDDAGPMPSMPASDANGATNVSKPRGYPLAILGSKVDDKFCCSFCKCILRNPMQTSCGHRFCQDCLKMMETLPQPLQCQSCAEEGITDDDGILDFAEIFEDKAARREMKSLQVKCMYPGCPWKGTFNEFMKHEEECDRKMVDCSQCGAKVSKGRLPNHETKSCPKRVIVCSFCREQIVFESKDKHNAECPKYLVKCEKCLTSVERCKLATHQGTDCANRMVICSMPECNTKLPMDKFLPHISKDENLAKHITHLLDKSEVLVQKLQTLENKWQFGTDSGGSYLDPSTSASGGDYTQASGMTQSSEGKQGEGAQADGGGLIHEDRQKLKLHEDLMAVLHSEILRCITKGEALGRGMEKHDNRLRDCYDRIEAINTRLSTLEAKAQGMMRNPFDQTAYGELLNEGPGSFTWIIKNYSAVRRSAEQREKEMICSPTFFSCPSGYQLRLKMYVNGEGIENRNKNVSLFLQTVKGPNDDLLLWPFSPKVHFLLVDQVEFLQHHARTYEADPMSPSSRRPLEDVGIAAGCPAFISLKDMDQHRHLYLPKDIVYLKFQIEMPKPHLDRINSLNPLNYITNSSLSPSSVKS